MQLVPGSRILRALFLCLVVALAAAMAVGCSAPVSSDQNETSTVPDTPPDPVDFNVVILVIGGPRYAETFGDPTHANIPRIWNDLRPQGTIFENFRNEGVTKAVSGHAAMLTGRWLDLAEDGSELPRIPTIFESFRYENEAPEVDKALIGGKLELEACTFSSHPTYGPDYSAYNGVHTMSDTVAHDSLLLVLETHHPRLVMSSFLDVDRKGDAGDWEGYLAQIKVADELVYSTWNYLQSDPFYAGKTFLFVTADHGRHDDAHGGFEGHGCGCDGCRRLMFLALGPGVREGHVVPMDNAHTQRDVCEMLGDILRFPTPYSRGISMAEMFEPVTGIRTGN